MYSQWPITVPRRITIAAIPPPEKHRHAPEKSDNWTEEQQAGEKRPGERRPLGQGDLLFQGNKTMRGGKSLGQVQYASAI